MLDPILSQQMWNAVQESSHVLLHLHPTPDGDSLGSALGMKHSLETLNKKVTLIVGDTVLPRYLWHLPGAKTVVQKSFDQLDLEEFDLFIILDSASPTQVTRHVDLEFPSTLRTIIIDHHSTNPGFAELNWIDSTYPATCQMVYELLTAWEVKITPDAAICLFTGMYTDTGGFQYPPTSGDTLRAAAALADINASFPSVLFTISNSVEPEQIAFQAVALSRIELHHNGKIALSVVPYSELENRGIKPEHADKSFIANQLKSVIGWEVGVGIVEIEPENIKISFRTRDSNTYHLGKISASLGGGGHAAAAGLSLKMPLEDAKYSVLQAIIDWEQRAEK